jgi:hypothetical protein
VSNDANQHLLIATKAQEIYNNLTYTEDLATPETVEALRTIFEHHVLAALPDVQPNEPTQSFDPRQNLF